MPFCNVAIIRTRFSLIKSKYAHCFHLPDNDGRLTYYERPGQSELNELKKLGVTKQELLDHYMYCMEYLWQVSQVHCGETLV